MKLNDLDLKSTAQGVVLYIQDMIDSGKLNEEQAEKADELLDLARDLERSIHD